jgi:hypothetical protein
VFDSWIAFGQTYNHAIVYTENCPVTLEQQTKTRKWTEFRAYDHCNEAIDWKLSRLNATTCFVSINVACMRFHFAVSPYSSSDNRDAIFAHFWHYRLHCQARSILICAKRGGACVITRSHVPATRIVIHFPFPRKGSVPHSGLYPQSNPLKQ